MKKKLLLLLLSLNLCAFIAAKKPVPKITVAPVSFLNAGAEDGWIPIFVQAQLTSDIQNFSDFTVIDRMAADAIMGEQKRAEQKAYLNNTKADFEYASLVNADYVVVTNLVKKGNSYSFTCTAHDVKKATVIGKSHSAASVSESALRNGSAIHSASYEILRGLGIKEKKLAALKQSGAESQTSEVESNYYTAKGIIQEEKDDGNFIAVLNYYKKAIEACNRNTEASSRLKSYGEWLYGSNLGSTAQADIQKRKRWQAIWQTVRQYNLENWAYTVYNPADLKIHSIDYNRGTADYILPVKYKINPDCVRLYNEVLSAYNSTTKLGDWGLDTSFWRELTKAEVRTLIDSGYYDSECRFYSTTPGYGDPSQVKAFREELFQEITFFGRRPYPRLDSALTLTAALQDKNGRSIASDTIRTIHGEGDIALQNVFSHYIDYDIKSDFKTANFVFKNIAVSKMDGDFKIIIKSN
ncbi:hypothetical protein DYE50_01785 [Treponema ruminis]|uniref:Lipoprotein n=1 Tax=Treponema ruminis TaxID=744515 RepID=A0A7W8GAP7_9SPIR|nr:hypothetical protein [Treponema ruminis]MBB5226887.1 hypothetical protein [Treponema ruminis]QSI01315.1 hypothetical protein DYE50_01785 [Treponema ruminis]